MMKVMAQVPKVEEGVFEFYICPETDPQDEDCLFKWPLELAGGGRRHFQMNSVTQGGLYEIHVMLPEGLTCDTCILLWTMITKQCEGDNLSSCSTQSSTLCADISIIEKKPRLKRGWNFLKSTLGRVLKGAARASKC
ncbi:putative Lytic polysaccharide mono-oxygenase, cellulose-degrading-containing protein 9 [Homarus americanus]|uniref:Putative Lytic polysaccharide mono-oxygenase, cellulose-degrading-containing protein 9 n=2 Tax=Homarus americanus TaxID=6706 RepID=A0A8J5JT13_HOMAM|nr:putative Lytic polysaccharide mono-oxygenase, cellulose-degrading-containing protein 9 [Homarus americanus]